MNSEEGISLAKMAVAILIVVLVIGAVIALAYAAYSWFNSGTAKLGAQVSSIDRSAYSQFDDTQISGTDVLSALKSYRESDIAIVICNLKNQGGTYSATPTDVTGNTYCALTADTSLTQATKTGSNYPATVKYDTSKGQYHVGAICYTADGTNSSPTAMKNTNFSPTTQTNNATCFVKQSAKWYANLIYSDETGDVCGILFRQMD